MSSSRDCVQLPLGAQLEEVMNLEYVDSISYLLIYVSLAFIELWPHTYSHQIRHSVEGKMGWDGWMASPTQWTWVWVNSRSWWWTRRPGVLRFTGLQRVGHDGATELNWTKKGRWRPRCVNWLTRSLLLRISVCFDVLWSQKAFTVYFFFKWNHSIIKMYKNFSLKS